MKIKILVPSALCLFFILSSPIYAAEFKCFVTADDDKQYIVLSNARSLEVAMQMTKRWVITTKDKKRAAVTQLLECLPDDKKFATMEAIGMDNQLGR